MALVGVGVSGLGAEEGEQCFTSRDPVEATAAVSADPRPASGLVGVAPAAGFEKDSTDLGGNVERWEELAGGWEAAGGRARVTSSDRLSNLAVATPRAPTTTVQVTLDRPKPGAGVVASFIDERRYVALEVDSSGRRLMLVQATDCGFGGDVLITATIGSADSPLVLALRRDGNRVEAIANGTSLGSRVVRAPDGPSRVGLIAGPGRSGSAARFDDLVLG